MIDVYLMLHILLYSRDFAPTQFLIPLRRGMGTVMSPSLCQHQFPSDRYDRVSFSATPQEPTYHTVDAYGSADA